ncbi:hypothetical protein COO60DRAFT_1648756 [Scenedesmus sp. NREL 46B-D3]|nr:hypothetical protein COO60DRAFT_1648756 [Scenedesmus sp. NREL 46B-D3]
MPVLKSWLTALKYCQRLQQGSEQPCIYIVCNEPDLQDTQRLVDSIQDMRGLHTRVVSNHCSNPAVTWAGEAADLAAAAAAVTAAGRSGPILAISCSLLLLPEHSVSRIIEHALLRDTSVCCFSRLSATDLQLDAGASPGAAAPGSKSSAGSSSSSDTAYGRLLLAADVPAPPLVGVEYADSLLYKQYKTLDPCLHEERAAVANSGGKAGSGAFVAASSSRSAASAHAKGLGTGNVGGGQLLSSQLAAAAVAQHVDSEVPSGELFFEQTGAVNAAGIQQPYYHLPKTFFSSAYVRAAEAAAGATLKAAHKH